ncbi:DUF2125 domain-containing protein [Sediminimonas sp.]|uniref:DUF2125 domain-containing protein n=1 Tax=Sediminimonas sp. TaxID=2823379 RepID=UPI0025F754AE|nr:DUF2125 domain-containing protein [Sediminimonas sp.]
MKRLVIVIVLAAALWSGHWFWAASGMKSDISAWFDARRAEGWAADYAALSVAGFPNRLDATLDAPAMADPATGWAWQAPFLQILRLSYDDDHVIAVWPDRQRLASPRVKYDLTSADMRASMVTRGKAATLERATLIADTLRIARVGANPGGGTAMTALNLAIKAQPGSGEKAAYRVALSAAEFAPPARTRRRIATGDVLPPRFDVLKADIAVTLDRPIDRHTLERARPQPVALRIEAARAEWGDMVLEAAGEVTIDERGRADGRITLRARNWRDILGAAVATGALPQVVAGQMQSALEMIAGLAGNPRMLDIPLQLAGGRVYLGPVPVGRAPWLRLP